MTDPRLCEIRDLVSTVLADGYLPAKRALLRRVLELVDAVTTPLPKKAEASGYRWVWDREMRVWRLGHPQSTTSAWTFVEPGDNWTMHEEFERRFVMGPEVGFPDYDVDVTERP